MDQQQNKIHSTKSSSVSKASLDLNHTIKHEQAPNNNKTNTVFLTIIKIEGQLFTNQIGRFPIASNHGNNCIIVFYAIDPNYIKSYPIKSRHHTKLLKAYKEVYQVLQILGYLPQLHKLDNETPQDIKNFITENNPKFQHTPPDIHRTNTAECAIRTWQNHFIAIHAGTPSTFHLSNWCKDLEQTDITLNMLCPCTTNPLLSTKNPWRVCSPLTELQWHQLEQK
jgi:hypothetical protein